MIRTVFYTLPDGRPVSYSVVGGPPLATPAAVRQLTVAGVRLRTYAERGLSYVTLVRNGRTCVLAGRVAPGILIALAAAPLRPAGLA